MPRYQKTHEKALTSWLSSEDMALYWYDKVIAEFPKTNAAHRAYVKKFKTLVGSRGSSGGGLKRLPSAVATTEITATRRLPETT